MVCIFLVIIAVKYLQPARGFRHTNTETNIASSIRMRLINHNIIVIYKNRVEKLLAIVGLEMCSILLIANTLQNIQINYFNLTDERDLLHYQLDV